MATVNSSNTTTLYSTTQTTPVQTGADIPQGQVNDTNFTTLYANTQGNATGGGVSGNLLVRGDLRVLGTSDLEGAVTISNSYIMPTSDGTNLQVLSTDGNGNATWQNISAVAGYAIQADTATGGADLTLTQVGTPVDSVKFAGGTNITVSRTDANTITISTVADNIPDGTAQGQVLYWNGSAWVASSNVTSSSANDRFVLQYNNSTAGTNAALFIKKNYGATAYTTNDGVGQAFQLDSDSQTLNQIATINAIWKGSPSATEITLNTNTLDNTVGPFTPTATFSVAQATLPGDLAVNGGDITTTNATGNLFNANAVIVNIGNGATTEVNLGNTASGRVQIKSPSIDSFNTTQAVFNTTPTTVNAFGAATTLNMAAATGTTTIGNVLAVNGETITVNANSTDADSFLYFKDTTNTEYLKWNKTDTRFEFSDQLYISQTEVPAVFERRVTTAEVNPNEAKGAVKLLQRVTDAASNATDDSGPAVVFGRTSGASATTEQLFANMGSVWYGTTTKASLNFNWSTDNYTEPTPGSFPLTYTLLSLGSDEAQFFNDSLYVNYAYVDSTKTATSITGSNTLVFGSAHGYTAGSRILYQTATANGLIQSSYYYVIATGLTSTQCQVSTISGGSAVTLTNGTGLTLTFAVVSNRIGINTDAPAYTLDVDGNARVTGNIISAGITAGNITVGVVDDNTISTTSGALDITAASGSNVEITASLTNATVGPTRIIRNTAETATGVRALSLRTDSTGTPAVGLGASLDYEVETAVGTFTRGGFVEVQSTDITSGSEDFIMNFGVTANGTGGTKATLDSDGDLQIDGDLTVTGTNITTGVTDSAISVDLTTAVTNLPIAALTVKTTSTGTPAVGFGTAINFVGQTAVSNFENAGFIAVASTDITGAAEDFRMRFGLMEAGGTYTTKMDLDSAGNLQVDSNLIADGPNIQVNSVSAAVDSFLYMKGTAEYLKWDNSNTRFEFSDDLEVLGNVDATSYNIDDTRARIDTGNSAAWSAGANVALTTTDKNVDKVIFYITDGTNVHTLEALALRTGAGAGDAMLTTYGEMYSSTPLASFTAEISAGALRIRGTNLTATTLTVSILSTTLL